MTADLKKIRFETGMTTVFAAVILVFVFAPLLFPTVPAPYWFHERFFNLTTIVSNFRETGVFTFDGATPTNDFSPLYLLIVRGLSAMFTSVSTTFFIAVRAVIGLFAALTLFLFDRLSAHLAFKRAPAERFLPLSFLLAAELCFSASGSDVFLALFSLFLNALCLREALTNPTIKTGLFYGLSVSLAVSARFDAVVFFVTTLLVFYFQFNFKNPITTKQLLKLLPALFVGLVPLIVYIHLQQTLYGLTSPAEFAAATKAQDIAPWRIASVLIVSPLRHLLKSPISIAVLTFPTLLLGLTAYASFPWVEREQRPADTVFYSLVWFPILHLILLASVTYITLPEYAFYPLAVGAPAALAFAVRRIEDQLAENGKEKETSQARLAWTGLSVCFCVIALFSITRPRSAVYQPIIAAIGEFQSARPGHYAMGGGAGMLAWKTGAEVARLDGTAMDAKLLNDLDAQSSLDKVLKAYRADYYVALNPVKGENTPCYAAREPAQNRFGGSNKGFSDWLCAAPVFERKISPKLSVGVFRINENGKAY